ncbi:MAG: hypothetical protein JNK23_16290 [Opitutaceae bacterium]|nr:hypothetical protein [Opitutaceae bacterium]
MPITRCLPSGNGLLFAWGLVALLLPAGTCPAAPVAVAIVQEAPWSPGDEARAGAGEFAVLMQIAELRRSGARAGLLGVGAARGVFAPGAERALRFAALNGVAVAKLGARGDVAPCPDEIFIDAGVLSEAEAQRILREALATLGSPPRAANPHAPTVDEVAAVRAHMRRLQQHFILANATVVARN